MLCVVSYHFLQFLNQTDLYYLAVCHIFNFLLITWNLFKCLVPLEHPVVLCIRVCAKIMVRFQDKVQLSRPQFLFILYLPTECGGLVSYDAQMGVDVVDL